MPSSSRRVLFVADAGPEIGGGHVMRCLTLARALIERGAACAFVAAPEVAKILDAFADASISRVDVPSAEGFDACVFDSFRMNADDQRRIAQGRPTLVIDNLADRALACDLLMEPDPGRDSADYDGLVPEGAKLLLGPEFALVRPEFAALRDQAVARRKAGADVQRVLVSMGLTDVGGITARVVDRILPRLGDAKLDVVLGQGAPSLDRLEALQARDPRVGVRVDVRDMATLMAEGDVCIGAGGASIWERATLGLPTLLVVLADNQANVAAWLADHDASEIADARAEDFDAAFDRGFTTLLRNRDRRARLSTASAQLCDGLGATRVADAFLALV
jgi:UDP-2,4-diacetamido-2,4,6-trideoxy-beta-L-altropyranose hydrolase